MLLALLLIIFFLLIVIGTPIAIALGASVIVTSLIFDPIPLGIIGQKIFANLDHFTLMAVPFFFFAAALMEQGGLVDRLLDFARTLVGHRKGGLGQTSVLSCIFFAAISGSSPATVAGIGRIMYPALLKEGYSPRYSIGALTTTGSIGILIPPSIPLILYGFVTQTSIARLFAAGIIPGLIYGAAMMAMARFLAGRENVQRKPRASLQQRGRSLRAAAPALLLPILILIGIYGLPEFHLAGNGYPGGAIFTPTEASIFATLLALIIGMFIYRELSPAGVVRTIVNTAPSVGMIFFITVNALLFSFFITRMGIPQSVSNFLIGIHMQPWQFLLVANLLLMIIGFFLEGIPVIMMFIPVLFPAATSLGIDPIHFGIVVIVNIELALITPPVGLNLFVGGSVSGLSTQEVFRACLPWMAVTLFVLAMVTYVPSLSLFLPHLLFG